MEEICLPHIFLHVLCFRASQITSNDSGGKRLAAALTETRFGACNINLEMKHAALIPPRFLLQRGRGEREREDEEEARNKLIISTTFIAQQILSLPDVDVRRRYIHWQCFFECLET
jgi:hypothetical protein